jgi:hypothetical protein
MNLVFMTMEFNLHFLRLVQNICKENRERHVLFSRDCGRWRNLTAGSQSIIPASEGIKFQVPKAKIGEILPFNWEKTPKKKWFSVLRGNTGE